jgi:glycosyltransferase involved in cell wall biosynthesis
VVVSDVGGMRETVRNEQSGLLVRAGDEEALADASVRVLSDQKLRDQLRLGGLRRSQAFDLDLYVDSIERLYKELTGAKRK